MVYFAMKIILRWVFIILLLFLALVFFGAANKLGLIELFILAILCEGAFWYFGLSRFNLSRFKKRKNEKTNLRE